ncbi:MAG TPA: MFS transporter [Syntrophorhabdales bacterium]|nr:MFS transporter [Syntrophorhabdales bacterium]
MSPFFLLCAAGLSAIFSSTIAKSPVLPLFASHLGADPVAVGSVAAVSAFTGVLFSIPIGMLSDRLGRRKLLLCSALVFSTAPFLYPFITKLWQLGLVRFYHGLATAAFVPVAMAHVADISHEERGERLGWFSTATLLGRFVAPLVGGAVIGLLAFNPLLSYKAVYLLCGVAGVIALVIILNIHEPEKSARRRQSWREVFQALRVILSNPAILITSISEAAILFAYGTFETFLPLYALKLGLNAYEIGICLSAQVISLALTKPIMGRFSDRHGRPPQIFAGALLASASIGGFALLRSFIPFLVLSLTFGICMSTLTSATSAFIADLSRTARGSAMGILGSIMDIGHTTGPLVAGAVAGSLGYPFSFVTASAVLVGAALLFASVVFKKKWMA